MATKNVKQDLVWFNIDNQTGIHQLIMSKSSTIRAYLGSAIFLLGFISLITEIIVTELNANDDSLSKTNGSYSACLNIIKRENVTVAKVACFIVAWLSMLAVNLVVINLVLVYRQVYYDFAPLYAALCACVFTIYTSPLIIHENYLPTPFGVPHKVFYFLRIASAVLMLLGTVFFFETIGILRERQKHITK